MPPNPPALQSFTATTNPEQGPPRLARLRAELARRGLSGFLVPRADAHQGEYVSARDDRLAWLTGFTGSAGFCIMLPEIAGVFVDGRYRLQVREQIDTGAFTPVDWPDTAPAELLREQLPGGGIIGFDPWLHTPDEIRRLEKGLQGSAITLQAVDDNPLDAIWPDQPPPACAPARAHPEALAGRSARDKRESLAHDLRKEGRAALAITLPDSLCWLLNIRGADIPRNPVMQGFALLHGDARVDLFTDAAKLSGLALGEGVSAQPADAFLQAAGAIEGSVQFDPATAPVALARALKNGVAAPDPILMAKACKNEAELAGMREAHIRDGAAMVEFLAWYYTEATEGLSEIDMAVKLESCRRATGELIDLSFDTISSTGPNAAINHYRVTEASNRRLEPGDLFLLDSGGQYADGTTDITRTLPVGPADAIAPERRAAFSCVLKGMIALSRARFPRGVAGAHLDALARYPLWLEGMDYDHGTGHGVGAALSVHEGPVRISRASTLALAQGMILSNEPGYYRAGGWGIRIENLVVVQDAVQGTDKRVMLEFETLTLCPIDTGLIVPGILDEAEIAWLNAYHASVAATLAPLVSPAAAAWLQRACTPLGTGS
ncbi:MAG: aminopeptidase P family protein [Pararhodobacter sp.]|nr:aminopeptidase P family protein [Pararhodobacter sp.]